MQNNANPTPYYYREKQFFDLLIHCTGGTMTSKAVNSYNNVNVNGLI